MKIHLIISIFLGFSKCVLSQSFEQPMDWGSSNRYSIGNGAGATVSRSTTSKSGLAAVRLESKYSSTITKTIPGVVTTGNLKEMTAFGGQGYSLRSQKLIGFYRYSPVGSDKANVKVLLSRWNATVLKKDTIAYGTTTLGSMATFNSFEVLLKYSSTLSPDTQLVVISSSQNSASAMSGSTLLIDDVAFSGTAITTGVSVRSAPSPAMIYPNPAPASFTIRAPEAIEKLCIINSIGEEVYQYNNVHFDGEVKINSGLLEGLYLLHIFYKSGAVEVIQFVRTN